MKLNKREKIMLFVLLYFGILAGSFQFLLKPIFTDYLANKASLVELKAQKKDAEMLVGQEALYEEQIDKIVKNIEDNVQYFPSSIDMEKTHSLLSELGRGFGLTLTNLNVPKYESVIEIDTNAEVPASQLKKNTIEIEFEGTYAGVAKFIDAIDEYGKALRIVGMKIEPVRSNTGETSKIKAQYNIDVYSVPREDTENFYNYVFPNAPGIQRENGGF